MIDPAARAAFALAIQRQGLTVTFQRVVGTAPTATLAPVNGATVQAIVRNMLPDTVATAATGYSASQVGSLEQADREVLVMAEDLAGAGYPLPLRTGDQIILAAEDGGETLSVVRPDHAKRKIAGVISCTAAGMH